jgi:cbb3-type cytochrome oxidase maturation protein
MSVMFILLPVALLFSAVAVLAFLLAARAGQFDDLKTPALRILHEDADTDVSITGTPASSATARAERRVSAAPKR